MSKRHLSIAALVANIVVVDGVVPTEFRILPYGRFRSADGSGRPVEVSAGWSLDRPRAAAIAAARGQRETRLVIDYEHQTLKTEDNGKPAPASGWAEGGLEAREDGLYITGIDWVGEAAALIAARKYRYISPVFAYDKRTGEVIGVHSVALTNTPGLDGLTDLAGAAALSALLFSQEEPPMKELLLALGLTETATEAEALAALAAMKSTQVSELAALRGAAPDPAKYVSLAVLTATQADLATARTELAALGAKIVGAELDGVVSAALKEGKLLPAQESWARELGTKDMAALKGFIETAPVVAPAGTQTQGKTPAGAGTAQQTDTDLAVMKSLGLTAEQFAAGKQEA